MTWIIPVAWLGIGALVARNMVPPPLDNSSKERLSRASVVFLFALFWPFTALLKGLWSIADDGEILANPGRVTGYVLALIAALLVVAVFVFLLIMGVL